MASTNKTELGLCLWVGTDHVKRMDFVSDNIIIDGLLKGLMTGKSDKGHTHDDYVTEDDANRDYINAQSSLKTVDPNVHVESFFITKHANCPNSEKHFYILNLHLTGKNSNRSQIAIEYDKEVTTMYIRAFATNWKQWQEVLTTGSITKSHVGLGDVKNYDIATKAEAEAGTSNVKYMTPLRTFEGIARYLFRERYVNRQSLVSDFDTITTPGWYVVSGTTNAPTSKDRHALLVMDTESIGNYNNVVQMAFDRQEGKGFYFRNRRAGTWSAWAKIGFYDGLREMVSVIKNVTVPVSAWTYNSGTKNWEAAITNSRIKQSDNVDVNVQIEYLYIMEDAGGRGATKEFNGSVKIYSMDKPANDIIVDVVINREVI